MKGWGAVDSALTVFAERDDQIRQVRAWLCGDAGLSGRVELIAERPGPGELGVGVEALMVALAPGGVAVAMISGLFGWLRSRKTPVRLRVRRADGAEVELETALHGRVSARELPVMVQELAAWADGGTLDPAVAAVLSQPVLSSGVGSEQVG